MDSEQIELTRTQLFHVKEQLISLEEKVTNQIQSDPSKVNRSTRSLLAGMDDLNFCIQNLSAALLQSQRYANRKKGAIIESLYDRTSGEPDCHAILEPFRRWTADTQSAFGKLAGHTQEWVSRIEQDNTKLKVSTLEEWCLTADYELVANAVRSPEVPTPSSIVARVMLEASSLYGAESSLKAADRCSLLANRVRQSAGADTVLLYVIDADAHARLLYHVGFRIPRLFTGEMVSATVPLSNYQQDLPTLWEHVSDPRMHVAVREKNEHLRHIEGLSESIVIPLDFEKKRFGILVLGYREKCSDQLEQGCVKLNLSSPQNVKLEDNAFLNLGLAFSVAAGGQTAIREMCLPAPQPHTLARATLCAVGSTFGSNESWRSQRTRLRELINTGFRAFNVHDPICRISIIRSDAQSERLCTMLKTLDFTSELIDKADAVEYLSRQNAPGSSIDRNKWNRNGMSPIDELSAVVTPPLDTNLSQMYIRLSSGNGAPIEPHPELTGYLQSTFETIYALAIGQELVDMGALSNELMSIGSLELPDKTRDGALILPPDLQSPFDYDNKIKNAIKNILKAFGEHRPEIKNLKPVLFATWPFSWTRMDFDRDLDAEWPNLILLDGELSEACSKLDLLESLSRLGERRENSMKIIKNRNAMVVEPMVAAHGDGGMHDIIGMPWAGVTQSAACVPLMSSLGDRARGVSWLLFSEPISPDNQHILYPMFRQIGWFINAILYSYADINALIRREQSKQAERSHALLSSKI